MGLSLSFSFIFSGIGFQCSSYLAISERDLSFLATLVALHFTPVSERVSDS